MDRPVAEEVLAGGIDLVGMGSALAVDPDLPNRWRRDAGAEVALTPVQMALRRYRGWSAGRA